MFGSVASLWLKPAFPLLLEVGAVLRLGAVVALRRGVTWDRLDLLQIDEWRDCGLYRYVKHPMTLGLAIMGIGLVPVSSVSPWVWLAWFTYMGSVVGIYLFERWWLDYVFFDPLYGLNRTGGSLG